MNVKVFRMSSGEDVVANVIETKDDTIVVSNPIVAFNQGDGRVGFAPYSPLLRRDEKELEINTRWIVYIANVNDELVEQYEEMFSTIKTPSSKLIL